MNYIYPYELPKLPFAYDALEPYIDAETMHYHHDKHFATYIDNLNKALSNYPALQKQKLPYILQHPEEIPEDIRVAVMRNGGGVYNHNEFFNRLTPPGKRNNINPSLKKEIERDFKSLDNFIADFSVNAQNVFGSGYTALVRTKSGLKIINLKNQETTIEKGYEPVILLDVWEHAYYLKYKNMRSDYIKNFWNIVDF